MTIYFDLNAPEFRPDFDPFEILGVNKDDFTDFESFKKPAKKIYREKSRTLHPDKKCAEWMKDRSRLYVWFFFAFFQKIFVVLLDSQRKLFIKENDGQQCTEEVKAEFDAAWALIVKGNGL